jgi:hypothetical protein
VIKFSDLVTTKKSGCARCSSILYALPCQIDRKIAGYFKDFGQPIYPLKRVKLLRINAGGGFHIEGRVGAKIIKFTMPKKFEKGDLKTIKRKTEFESNLIKWMEDKLKISISTSE